MMDSISHHVLLNNKSPTVTLLFWIRILVQVTIYGGFRIGRDSHLDRSEAYDKQIKTSQLICLDTYRHTHVSSVYATTQTPPPPPP